MKIFNQDQKQPIIQVATNLPIEGLTDAEMAALTGGWEGYGGPGLPGPDTSKRRGPAWSRYK